MEKSTISRENPLPLYHQIKDYLKKKIDSGDLEPHDRLPSGKALAEEFDVSQMTIRQALSELAKENYIYRKRGEGSYVAEHRMRHAILNLNSFSEEMEKRGSKPSSEVLQKRVIDVNENLCNRLNCSKKEKVVKIKRIRFADKEPLALQTAFIRRKFCPGLEDVDFTDTSLYEVLENKFDITISKANQEIEAISVGDSEAEHLKVEAGSNGLLIRRTVSNDLEEPLEFTRSVYRGDRYTLFVSLHR